MGRKVNYFWRLFGTGLGFASFSVGGLLLRITVFPLVAVFSRTEEKRIARTRNLVCLSFRSFVFLLKLTGVIDVSRRGFDRLGQTNGRLVIANHPSLLDVVLLVAMMPKAQCIVKHSLMEHRFFGGVLQAAGYIRNDGNPEELLEKCKTSILNGHDILIFPEGTRSVPGTALKFQRGFANIAALVPCDIQPVVINCRPIALTKGSKWYEIPPSKVKFDISVEEQLDIETFLRHEPRSKVVRRLTRELEEYYSGKLCHE